jgi:hypothetical protein
MGIQLVVWELGECLLRQGGLAIVTNQSYITRRGTYDHTATTMANIDLPYVLFSSA